MTLTLGQTLSNTLRDDYPQVRVDLTDYHPEPRLSLDWLEVPKSQRKQGIGSDIMNRICKVADILGLTLTLSPTPALGATSKGRLVRFYKRFGFVENKGRNKDFTISNTMYRKPKTFHVERKGEPHA